MVSILEFFGPDPSANQRRWQRSAHNPVVSYGASWCREFLAPSTVLVEGGQVTVYAEGGAGDREAIGRYTADIADVFTQRWRPDPGNPLLELAPAGFDRGSVFDPAVVWFRGQLHLYYSATGGGAHAFAEQKASAESRPDDEAIGHAVEAGGSFVRDSSPVLAGRCPNAIVHDGVLYLFYVNVVAGGYRIYGARSDDGVTFHSISDGPVLDVGDPGSWDSFTVTTPKVFTDDGQFVMTYAGDDQRIDDPTGIGLATSDDLIRWRKHPGNPVLAPGAPGEFDCFSVASAVPFQVGGCWHISYAGGAQPLADGLQSQIGVARLVL